VEPVAHVLLADVNEGLRRTLYRLLTNTGNTVDLVNTAEEARERLGDRRVDVLVLSDELGVEASVQLLEHVRGRYPETMCLLLAGGGTVPVPGAALAHRVLRRPFQAEQFENALEELHEAGELVRRAVRRTHDIELHSSMFQQSLDERLFSLDIQPIFTSRARSLVAVELLLRSAHATLSGPLQVLDSVERSGREADLGLAVNELAAEWMSRVPISVDVFVNTHPAQFAGPKAVEAFSCLEPFASRVVLEITERAPLADYHGAEDALRELGSRGFRIAVDDIGSGYNSLSVLAELSPAFIKADMSIVRNADREPRKRRLLQLLASFASATGSELVAEGVETAEEAAAAEACGANLLQGYHLARPGPVWPPKLTTPG
jgi:EAL domain-containing protein (putative c-di-GMP-specific phosphodiesterase class I)